MAKKAKKLETKKGLKLKIVNPNAAGIDIACGEMQVCVPEDRDGDNNRTFGSFTCDLNEIAEWLCACGIETVAMESTGVYWLPLFFLLQGRGFDVVLCDAKSVKNYSGRKTDESDAEWLMLLHSYGLLKPCFQPENDSRKVRNLTRHRSSLLKAASREVEHMQKALEQMNVKIGNAISDILGKSGTAIITAIIGGNHDPESLALLADPRCRNSKETIRRSLEGTWDEDQLFILRQSYEMYTYIHSQMEKCEAEIAGVLSRYTAQVRVAEPNRLRRSVKRVSKKNSADIDVQAFAFAMWGVNPMLIPGMSAGTLLTLISELGHGFTDKFESQRQFCSWCNVVPNNKISGGKLLSSRVPKRNNPVGQALRLCANALWRDDSTLGAYFRRVKSKSGHMQAVTATAHKLAKIFYTMVKDKQEYDDSRVGLNEAELLRRRIERTKVALERMQDRLGKAC